MNKSGVEKGDRVGILLPNCPQFVIAYLATLSVGAVVVNMNPLYTESELRHIVESTQPHGPVPTVRGSTIRQLAGRQDKVETSRRKLRP